MVELINGCQINCRTHYVRLQFLHKSITNPSTDKDKHHFLCARMVSSSWGGCVHGQKDASQIHFQIHCQRSKLCQWMLGYHQDTCHRIPPCSNVIYAEAHMYQCHTSPGVHHHMETSSDPSGVHPLHQEQNLVNADAHNNHKSIDPKSIEHTNHQLRGTGAPEPEGRLRTGPKGSSQYRLARCS